MCCRRSRFQADWHKISQNVVFTGNNVQSLILMAEA
jgi:hypothetical protein